MGWKWRIKSPPERPEINLPIKDPEGVAIGWIAIDSNGWFVGDIEPESLRRRLAAAVEDGFVESFTLTANIQQPPPPGERDR